MTAIGHTRLQGAMGFGRSLWRNGARSLADLFPKGLYARARRGEVSRFTGISAPYEVPEDAELTLYTTGKTPDESAAEVLALLESLGLVDAD